MPTVRVIVDYETGVRLPVDLPMSIDDWNGYSINMKIQYSRGRYRCVRLTMTADVAETDGLPDVPEIPDELPDMPIATFIQDAAYQFGERLIRRFEQRVHDKEEPLARFGHLLPEGSESFDQRSTHLHLVALLYRLAEAAGAPPRKLVADAFGVSISTAGRWLAEARRVSLLPVVEVGTGGGRRRRVD
jgi:hypothetical protein